jgi:hypothetical protein
MLHRKTAENGRYAFPSIVPLGHPLSRWGILFEPINLSAKGNSEITFDRSAGSIGVT